MCFDGSAHGRPEGFLDVTGKIRSCSSLRIGAMKQGARDRLRPGSENRPQSGMVRWAMGTHCYMATPSAPSQPGKASERENVWKTFGNETGASARGHRAVHGWCKARCQGPHGGQGRSRDLNEIPSEKTHLLCSRVALDLQDDLMARLCMGDACMHAWGPAGSGGKGSHDLAPCM